MPVENTRCDIMNELKEGWREYEAERANFSFVKKCSPMLPAGVYTPGNFYAVEVFLRRKAAAEKCEQLNGSEEPCGCFSVK